ncbi:hypothetical protein HXA31_07930 [Salipaludibacillus agaradhaerens]|uniref:Uncharacterized protein n=1 Tax=Salipaludibacillus agaradhaerens TaxID=76935 RepID=A0A9Q4B0X9_SALAG|nr:hypothetical protein [Salipaludibacillus agaradhaerens]MCR6096146.1 hypothetical protein [Salipaludibacillus agaradhaerens]MCR6114295.1 hypothetical protein [Salipaludibacillus agaradhaerens]
MGLFGGKEEKPKNVKKLEKFMKRYQLEELDDKDLIVLQRIAEDLIGNKLFKMGMAFSFAKAEEQAKVTYLSALVEQNWMIIRQLSRMNKQLESLNDK